MNVPRRLLLGAVGALLLCLVTALPALPHASLLSSAPASGEYLEDPPQEIRLEFSEEMSTELSRVQVYDGLGRATPTELWVDADERTLRADLPGRGPDGIWSVEYRVLSVDGHPVVGGHTFLVGNGRVAQRYESRGLDLARWGIAAGAAVLLVGTALWLRRLVR